MNDNMKMNVNNVPEYAWEKPVWIVRIDDSNGSLWFYGAWDYSQLDTAVDIANKIRGIVITN